MRAERVAADVRHVPERFAEFRTRYIQGLAAHPDRIDELAAGARRGRVTILYAARDPEHNNDVIVGELVRDG